MRRGRVDRVAEKGSSAMCARGPSGSGIDPPSRSRCLRGGPSNSRLRGGGINEKGSATTELMDNGDYPSLWWRGPAARVGAGGVCATARGRDPCGSCTRAWQRRHTRCGCATVVHDGCTHAVGSDVRRTGGVPGRRRNRRPGRDRRLRRASGRVPPGRSSQAHRDARRVGVPVSFRTTIAAWSGRLESPLLDIM